MRVTAHSCWVPFAFGCSHSCHCGETLNASAARKAAQTQLAMTPRMSGNAKKRISCGCIAWDILWRMRTRQEHFFAAGTCHRNVTKLILAERCSGVYSATCKDLAMTSEASRSHDTLTLIAIGAVSYIFAGLCHEGFGHALVCRITGGKGLVLTSVFFRSDPGSRLVDAAGPCSMLLAGALVSIALARAGRFSPLTRLFLVFAMAFNFFWGAGYFLYSGIADEGDWALVIRGLPAPMFWRAALVVLGIVGYSITTRLVARTVAGFAGCSDVRRLILIPYAAAGVAACLAALFYRGDPSGALAGANVVLLTIPRFVARRSPATARSHSYVGRSFSWLIASAIIFLLFVALMGRGFRSG